MNKPYKVLRFDVDRNLGYLIQQITKDPTQEILAYFYGIASFVMDDILKNSKASFISKDVVLYYKDTPITFKIQLNGSNPRGENVYVRICITFPKTSENFSTTDLMTHALESGLGLIDEENMPEFQRPNLKSPKCLRDVRIKQNEHRNKAQPST